MFKKAQRTFGILFISNKKKKEYLSNNNFLKEFLIQEVKIHLDRSND